jgi:medium-chain acyl-[acyl-carrier-protein] hydrolase
MRSRGDCLIKSPKNLWFARPGTNPQARLRLFCFPYAGGGALIYRSWHKFLPRDVELLAVQLPGRETRLKEAPFTGLFTLVRTVAPVLLPLLDKPFAFFGHSLGALLSFEMARQIRREYGMRPAHLFVSGRGAPHLRRVHSPIHALPEAELVEELRNLNGTPEAVLEHKELLKLVLPALRADFSLCENYEYYDEEPLDCPISTYGGLEDKDTGVDRLEAWRDQTTASFSLSTFPGDHFFLHSSQSLLLERLSEELQQITNRISRRDRAKDSTVVIKQIEYSSQSCSEVA